MAKMDSLPSKYLLVLDPQTLVKVNGENCMDFLILKGQPALKKKAMFKNKWAE